MSQKDLSRELLRNLPFLRRYARALTGAQDTGDRFALITMEALIAKPETVDVQSVHLDLFRAFHQIWIRSDTLPESVSDKIGVLETRAQERLSGLLPNSREALLLHALEGFSPTDVGTIMDISTEEAKALIDHAFDDLSDLVRGDILIIEDEAVIAMDLESIARSMGHSVTGVARTETGAMQLAAQKTPDLVLSDIQLADGSSGIDAVNRLLDDVGDRPVIFITAFPERLLTGERPEPAFLITKPYTEDQVRVAVSQAMFFSTTEGMLGP